MMQPAAGPLALTPDQLRRTVDTASLTFETTADVAPLTGIVGQPRAMDAIEFGLAVQAPGFNLFVAGAPGSGRETAIRALLERFAPTQPTPSDWVYVYNFATPDRPQAIALPAGRGRLLAQAMDHFIQTAQREITRAFDSEDYTQRKQELLTEMGRRRDQLLSELQAAAAVLGYGVQVSQVGLASVPLVDGHPVTIEEFERLPAEQKALFAKNGEQLQRHIAATLRQGHQIEQEMIGRLKQLDQDIAMYAVTPIFEDLREQFAELPSVLAYLDLVRSDVGEHLNDFIPSRAHEAGDDNPMTQLQSMQQHEALDRYRVNVLIDHSQTQGAPVVIDGNPAYYNLVGRIDYRAMFGTMVTDFRQIKPGALQRANGGFLVLRVTDLLRNPFAWDALKRALMSREIQIENLGEQYTTLPMATLRPDPIPLRLKVILLGSLANYHLLYQLDEDFQELFKVKADFAPDMDWTADHVQHYAAFIGGQVRAMGLKHFDRAAVARVVEHGGRLREDRRKLSTRFLDIADLVTESSFWADQAGHPVVQAEDVDRAIAKKEYRSNLVEERVLEMISDGTIMIATTGERCGQVNGIAIASLGDYAFGKPSRITARVSVGQGIVQSIERETELSGPIHTKGFLILSGYLAGQYAQEWPLSLGATITFEQAYDEIEGDSASSAELYALLSALANVPVNQALAVTGSVNQYGEIQAVGGVTRKIEGYFEVCKTLGLTGEQGVLIPAANIPHLMLKDEVVAAVRTGQFHVWAIHTIDEGLELLTGRPAGARDADGRYPEDSLHALVEKRLRQYAQRNRDARETRIKPYDNKTKPIHVRR